MGTATTGRDGSTVAKVTPDISWWLAVHVDGRPAHTFTFHADGTLDQSVNTYQVRDDWIRGVAFPTSNSGTVELKIEHVAREAK